MRIATFFLLTVVLLAACKRESETRAVTVKVVDQSGSSPSCVVTYTSTASGTSAVVATSATSWSSPTLMYEPGQSMTVKVASNSPDYNYKVTIYVDGGIWKQGLLQEPQGELLMSGDIPAQ